MYLKYAFTIACAVLPTFACAQTSPAALTVTSAKPATSAYDEVSSTLQDILKIVEAYPGTEHQVERRAKLREVINPRFDFAEMAQRCLGANWQGRTPEEQQQFVAVFSDLLAKTYLAKIELIQRDTAKIDKEELDFPKALVKTTITYKGDRFPLDYKLMNKDGHWRVYDVVIENIGLVANYRNEFAGIIRRDSFQGLLAQLEAKNKRS